MRAFPSSFRADAAKWLATAAAGFLLCGASHAAGYPERTVRLIDPYAPGGSTSVVSTALSEKFQEITGQPMVVDHKPGAASNIGSDIVAKAAPDGYTLLLAASSLAINPSLYTNMPFDPVKDLAPVAIVIRTPNVLAVNSALPVHSVKELIDYAKAHPGQLNYGSSGNGATNHMGMELLKSQAKVQMQHVPFKGGGEAMAALLAGNVQVMFNPASTLVPQAKAGRLRMIAVGSPVRIPGLDLPTVSESGLPGFQSDVWFGLFAPAGTPPAVVAKLNADVNQILKDPKVAATLKKSGLEPVGGSAEDLHKLLVQDTARWGTLVKETGLKIQ